MKHILIIISLLSSSLPLQSMFHATQCARKSCAAKQILRHSIKVGFPIENQHLLSSKSNQKFKELEQAHQHFMHTLWDLEKESSHEWKRKKYTVEYLQKLLTVKREDHTLTKKLLALVYAKDNYEKIHDDYDQSINDLMHNLSTIILPKNHPELSDNNARV
jgi:hypothetical protein